LADFGGKAEAQGIITDLLTATTRHELRLWLEAKAQTMSEESFAVAPEIINALQADQKTWENYLALPDLYRRIRIDNIQAYLSGNFCNEFAT
jgi:hypothetical protein